MRATGDRDRRPSPYPRPADAPRRAPLVRNKTARRRRFIGATSAVVVAGVVTMGFLGGGTATADPSSGEVVFSGKCGLLGVGLGNNSTPSPGSLTVDSGEKVTFTNELNTDATLHFGGTEYDLDEGDSKAITMKYSTEVLMSPHCAIMPKDNSESMVVNVQQRQGDDGGGSDDGGDTGGGSGGGDSDGGSTGGSGDDGSTAGGGQNSDKPDDGDRPTKSKADGKAGDPNKGDDADESSDEQGTAPGGSEGGGDGDVEKVDTAAKANTESSASALLAALAALCLAGVGFAALRTYITSRSAASA